MIGVAVPDVYQHSDMVVPVQEDQLLFPKHNEECIPELVYFGDGEHESPETGHAFEVGGYTIRVLESVVTDRGHEFWQRTDGPEDAKDCQNPTPKRQCRP